MFKVDILNILFMIKDISYIQMFKVDILNILFMILNLSIWNIHNVFVFLWNILNTVAKYCQPLNYFLYWSLKDN
jgi:hypothetical protein